MLSLNSAALRPLRWIWQAAPVPLAVRRAIVPRLHALLFPVPAATGAFAPMAPARIAAGDLIVSGFLSMHTGIGRSGRMIAEALVQGGAEPRLHDLELDREGSTLADAQPGGVWLSVCNPPEAVHFMHVAQSPIYRSRYRIGFWAWELPVLPPDWIEALPLFHEVWAGSPFVAEAIAKAAEGTGVRVRMVPYPLPEMSRAAADRARFGWREGELAVLCMYDVRSTAARKNPQGAVEAFQRAFAADDAGVRLIVKVNGPDAETRLPKALTEAIAGWPNITLLVAELSDDDTDALLASCDVFVSLHRSEGFGLSIAQSLVLGRAVVATAFSGNADFQAGLVEEVPFTLVPASDPTGRYELPDQMWAEPDLDWAAAALRRLAGDREAMRAQGERARAQIAERLPRVYPAADFAPWLAPAKG